MDASPIRDYLGASFDTLPAEIRRFHAHPGKLIASGMAEARVHGGLIGAMICRLVGLPKHGPNQPVTVTFEVLPDGTDYWVRNFSGRSYRSRWYPGRDRFAGQLVEHLGVMQNGFMLTAKPDGLVLELDRFAFCGVVLPRWLAPRCTALETGKNGNFSFDIVIDVPVIGRLIEYRGTLVPQP